MSGELSPAADPKIDPRLWVRLWPLLEEAERQPEAGRDAWCAAQALDPELAAALRRVLSQRRSPQAAAFLHALPPILATEPQAPAGGALQPGARIGPWRLVRPLGEGGMSVVWLADRHDGDLRRQVALKLPHAGPGHALLAERMRREGAILSALEHRHIARLYDVGVTDEGVPFMVLEYVDGEHLLAHCARRRLPLVARLALFEQVLQAVAHAHASLVLHRDLKPSNILVGPDGEVKLLDFGIARLLDRTGGPLAGGDLTRQGGAVLTPDYAAPEQVSGGALTTATDVYALGVVLFELLTGRRPYRLARASAAELEQAILAAEPPRPSTLWRGQPAADAQAWSATPGQLRRALAGDLDAMVATALRKPPERRYAGADAMLRDLQALRAGRPVAARPDSAWLRAHRFVRRHALAVGAVAAVVVSLGIGLATALAQAERARQEAAKATAIQDFLVGLFERNDLEHPDTLRRRSQTVQGLLEQSASALNEGLVDQPQVRSELMGVVGRLLHGLELGEPALALRRQRAQVLAHARAPAADRIAAALDVADSELMAGQADAARQTVQAALALCPGRADAAGLACLQARARLAKVEIAADRLPQAREALMPALAALSRVAPGSAEYADALFSSGLLLSRENRPAEASQAYQQAMALREALWGPSSVRLARERYEHAVNLFSDDRPDAARQEFTRALQVMQAALGAEHPVTARVELQLGRLRRRLNGDGQDQVQHAVGVLLAQAGRIDPVVLLEAHTTRVEGLMVQGRLQAAEHALDEALAMPGLAGLDDSVLLGYRAQLWSTLGRHAQARQLAEGLRDRLARRHAEADRVLLDAEATLGAVRLNAGDTAGAAEAYRRARSAAGEAAAAMARGDFSAALPVLQARHAAQMARPATDRFRGVLTVAASELAQALAGLGRHAEARPLFEQALAASESAGPLSPRRLAIHARFALTLHALGDDDGARRQLALASATQRAQPELSEHLLAPWRTAVHALQASPAAPVAVRDAVSRTPR